MTTTLIQRINVLDGISTYSFLVAAIAVIVALLMQAAITQFMMSSARRTIQSLRIYGVSRLKIAVGFVLIAVACAAVGFVASFALSPAAQWAHRRILAMTGLSVADVEIATSGMVSGVIVTVLLAFSAVVVIRTSGVVTRIGHRVRKKHRNRSLLQIILRMVGFIAFFVGLVALFRQQPTMNNINEMTFGVMFAALLATWCIVPLIIVAAGHVIRRWGVAGLPVGGLITADAMRLSSIALIASLLLGVGGTSAMLTLTSSSAGKYMALHSISADAITTDAVKRTDSSVVVSSFSYDGGWMYGDKAAEQAPVIRFDPKEFQTMVKPTSIAEGSLAAVEGNKILADGARYRIGDSIVIVDDSGRRRDLEVVALSAPYAIFGGAIGVNATSFPISAEDNVRARAYATAAGGIDEIAAEFPSAQWQTIQQFVDADLKSVQSSQMLSVFSMIGGVSIVAVLGFLYSIVGYSVDRRRVYSSLARLGMSRRSNLLVFGLVGFVVALASGIMTACGLGAAVHQVQKLLESLGVNYPLDVPWGMLVLMWVLITLAAVFGMIAGQRRSRVKRI